MRKIGKKRIYSTILDPFQNDEVFHVSQLQHNWTKEWCEYLDYIRTIDISHTASPEQLERYATLYHFRYDPKKNGKRTSKKPSRLSSNNTSYRKHERRNRSDSRIKKTSQLPRGSGPREARLAYMALSQLEMVLRGKPNLRIKIPHNGLTKNQQKRMPRETEKRSLMMIGGKQIGGPSPGGEIKMEVELRSLGIFPCLRISHPRSGNNCVCDGECTHTPCRTHIFLTHFPCVAYRRRVHAWRKVFAVRMSYLSISPSPFSCFIRLPCCSLTVISRPPSHLPCRTVPDPKSAGLAHFRTSGGEFGYLADPTHSTGYEPKEFDKITSADGDTTPINHPNYDNISDFSKITSENTGLFGVLTMFESSVSNVSPDDVALQIESKESMHRESDC